MKAAQALAKITFKNILYATDFSEASEAALPYVLEFAKQYGAKVHALHVRMPSPGWALGATPLAQVMAAEQELAQRDADHLHVMFGGVNHDVTVTEGDIWQPLADMMEKYEIDLVIIGTHGRTGVGKLVLGSIAAEIFRNVDCPVLTVGPRTIGGYKKHTEINHLLVPVDFSPESLGALPYAISLAQEHAARLTLMTVLDEAGTGDFITPEMLTDAAKRRLLELIPPDADLWCKPEAYVAVGKPVARIVAIAEERKADLIVLGVKEASTKLGRATHLARAVAQEIAAKSPCPVLTVKLNENTAVLKRAYAREDSLAAADPKTCESCT
jgi:nucleotide-binding universal stress UspA family protein